MTEQEDEIRENLTERIEAYNLQDRITFDDSAIAMLSDMGRWDMSEQYAASAILNALQNQKDIITADDINKVDIFENINLMTGGKDIWDQINFIGTQAPDLDSVAIGFRRYLNNLDANRVNETQYSIEKGKLPQYALAEQIEYSIDGITGRPQINVPFRFKPSKEEVEAVAHSLAKFMSEHTGETQEVNDISGSQGIQYFVQDPIESGTEPLLNRPNYRVRNSLFPPLTGASGLVTIDREILCKHDVGTLEAYVLSVKPVGK